METWSGFTAAQPHLASAVHALLFQYGPGLAYLATVREDGGPRLQLISPVITEGGLFCFIVDPTKRDALRHDGRYALHSCPPEESDDSACLSGVATPVTDPERVQRVAHIAKASPEVDWWLFELLMESAVGIRRPCTTSSGLTKPTSREEWRA
jgi:hypothetical protein